MTGVQTCALPIFCYDPMLRAEPVLVVIVMNVVMLLLYCYVMLVMYSPFVKSMLPH